ncbi:Dof zinc finger protein DOF3.1 [Sesamum angolense]|uniref:Dof zinc finger protein DOF3.1 n=1 Tax=Sesamum angolense TaxID=2727404 RepID=A0AAE1WL89_9LAMI|nr:Dof zinc finger protein DOF3.1 [Sesamum angolense]
MQDPSLYSQIKAQVQPPQPQFPEQEHLKCPRCDSTNTKFCYYNNYNLSQPATSARAAEGTGPKAALSGTSPSAVAPGRTPSAAPPPSAAKRPAAAPPSAPPSSNNSKHDDSRSKNGETAETLPLKGENFVGQFGNLLEAGGSFSSLLGSSGGQFGNFLDGLGPNGSTLQITDHFGDPGSGQNVDPQVLESGSSSNADGFLNIQGGGSGGDTGCWGGGSTGWPDLAIYTPGPNFQ